jgi:8-oxo-dGTP pyrophosphatase MutT (NUDIX family)
VAAKRTILLRAWLLPGGHLEPTDTTAQAAALRELAEETGNGPDAVTAIGEPPIHIDAHPIPANSAKGEPDHTHIDSRFAFRTTTNVQELQAEEVIDAAWRGIDSLDETLQRRVAMAGQRMQPHTRPRRGDS